MSFSGYLDNITLTISNTSSFVSYCTSSVEGTANGMQWYITLFPGITDYILAFFMNLGGNVVSISRIF